MNEKHLTTLTDLGLSSKQAKTYLTLINLGEATVVDIAKASGIKRTTLYPILDELQNMGYVYKTKVHTQTLYVAERPLNLCRQFESKIEEFSAQAEDLESLYSESIKRPRVLFFDGNEGFRKIWHVVLNSGEKEYMIITDPHEFTAFVKKSYITGKIIKEKVKLGIRSRQIISSSRASDEIVAKDKDENRESKILPHTHKVPVTKIIFGDNVALIAPAIENSMLIIESESYAKTERSLFEALWEKL